MLFAKKIQSPFEEGILSQQKIKNRKIKLGSKLIVEANQYAFVCVKNKAYEKFYEGEFELNGGFLPQTFKVCGLNKPRKRRISKELYYPQAFNASIIFLNLQEYKDVKFKTPSFLLFDEHCDVRLKIEGSFDFEIFDKNSFADFVAKYKRGNDYLMNSISKFVAKKIRYEFHKEEISIVEFLMKNSNYLYARIEKKLTKRLDKIGIKINNFTISNTILCSRSQRKVNELLASGDIVLQYQNKDIDAGEIEC